MQILLCRMVLKVTTDLSVYERALSPPDHFYFKFE